MLVVALNVSHVGASLVLDEWMLLRPRRSKKRRRTMQTEGRLCQRQSAGTEKMCMIILSTSCQSRTEQ